LSDGKQSDLFREILMRQLVESSPVAPTGPTWDALASLLPQAQARPRAFVGFSSTDRWQFTQMLGWNAHEDIDVDFADCQLDRAVKSDDEQYVKSSVGSIYIAPAPSFTASPRFVSRYV